MFKVLIIVSRCEGNFKSAAVAIATQVVEFESIHAANRVVKEINDNAGVLSKSVHTKEAIFLG